MKRIQRVRKNNGASEEDLLFIGAVIIIVALFFIFLKRESPKKIIQQKSSPISIEQTDPETNLRNSLKLMISAEIIDKGDSGFLLISYSVYRYQLESAVRAKLQ